jgi:hypothetical protein
VSSRREIIVGLASFAGTIGAPRLLHAQAPPAFLRLGAVSPTPRRLGFLVPFERRMAELGYAEGRNFTLDFIELDRPDG